MKKTLHAVLPLLLATVILFSSAVSIAGAVSLNSGGELAAVGGENDVFVLAGTSSFISTGWAPDPESYVMNKGDDGVWSIVVPDVAAIDDTIYSVKVVQFVDGDPAQATWHGMDGTDLNVDFMMSGDGDVTVTYDPETAEITVSGSNVIPPVYDIWYIAAAGSGDGNFLNGVMWDPADGSNYMEEVADGVYEITFEGVDTNKDYMVKFAANGDWDINWGAVKGADAPEFGVAIECGYNGENIKFTAEADEDTVDITLRLDISNWDTMKKTGATYTIILDGEEYAQDPTSAPAGSTKYYIAGSFNGWKIENDNEMFRNTSADTFEYALRTDFLTGDEFKVAAYDGVNTTWFPEGDNNNYVIDGDGTYVVYFRPDSDGGDDWFYGCIYAGADESDNPTEEPEDPTEEPENPTDEPEDPTEEPTGEPEDPTEEPLDGAAEYYVVGSFTDWQVDEAYKMPKNTAAEADEYIFCGLYLSAEDQFKVVSYNASIQGGSMTWYPEGMGNNYGENGEITADGFYTIYFRPDGDGGDDWFYGCIYAGADESDNPTEEPEDLTEEPENPTEEPDDPTEEPEDPTDEPEDPTEEPAAPGTLLGDVDGDGEITIFDATAIQRYLANLPTEKFIAELADTDGDGEITIFDATYIQRHIAGFDDGYPIGTKVL